MCASIAKFTYGKPCLLCRVEGEEPWQPDYATLTWVVQHILRLAAPHVLHEQQRKVTHVSTVLPTATAWPDRRSAPHNGPHVGHSSHGTKVGMVGTIKHRPA